MQPASPTSVSFSHDIPRLTFFAASNSLDADVGANKPALTKGEHRPCPADLQHMGLPASAAFAR